MGQMNEVVFKEPVPTKLALKANICESVYFIVKNGLFAVNRIV